MPPLLIQPASIEDAATLLELGERTFRQTYETTSDSAELQHYVATHFTLERVRDQIAAQESYFFTASQGTRVVGYLHLRIAYASRLRPPA